MTQNRLAAIMIAISAHEVSDSSSTSKEPSSPMALSRNEAKYWKFYYGGTTSDDAKAYWSPGVGLWQLDILQDNLVNATRLNHAERADTADTGGPQAAKHIYRLYCDYHLWNPPKAGQSYIWIGSTWAACPSNTCKTTFQRIYNSQDDSLNIHVVEGWNGTAGGVVERKCRWDDGGEFPCFLYDTANPEGYMGTGNRPLAHPFISFTDIQTDSGRPTRYAVWPKTWPQSTDTMSWPTATAASGEDAKTIFKAVPRDTLVRKAASPTPGQISPDKGPVGWFDDNVNGKVLQVQFCSDAAKALDGVGCYWKNLNTGAVQSR